MTKELGKLLVIALSLSACECSECGIEVNGLRICSHGYPITEIDVLQAQLSLEEAMELHTDRYFNVGLYSEKFNLTVEITDETLPYDFNGAYYFGDYLIKINDIWHDSPRYQCMWFGTALQHEMLHFYEEVIFHIDIEDEGKHDTVPELFDIGRTPKGWSAEEHARNEVWRYCREKYQYHPVSYGD